MKRWIFIALIVVVVVANRNSEEVTSTSAPNMPSTPAPRFKQSTDSAPIPIRQPVPKSPDSTRVPAQAASTYIPKPLTLDIDKEESIPLNGSNRLIENMAVMDKKSYNPSFGSKVHEDKNFVYFRPAAPTDKAWPVAFDPTSRKLYPVSHILHIKGATEEVRSQLLAEGMDQYYYQPRMKLLSVKTTPSTVVKNYQQLKERGFDVKMEILKEGVRPN